MESREGHQGPILVTGGAGFIGSHLVERLVAAGAEVRVLDDLSQGRRENLDAVAERITFFHGSYGDAKLVREALDGVHTVYHLAALLGVKRVLENPWHVLEVDNFDLHGFFDAVRAADVRSLVYASSSEVYGDGPVPYGETDGLRPRTPYQAGKLMGEVYARVLHDQYGIDTASLRYFNVYGPRQESSAYGFVASIFLANARAGRPHTIYGTGQQTRDFTYIDDTVDATVRAATRETNGGVFNVGTGHETSVLDLADAIDLVTGSPVARRFEPERPDEIQRRVADTRLTAQVLGFRARVALEDGIRRTWEGTRGSK